MMNLARLLLCLTVLGCALCLLSCKQEKEGRVDASRPLEQSFQTSEPQAKQAIATVKASLKAGDYTQAGRALEPVLVGRKLTPQQREAVGLVFKQINQAVAADPSLDSKELYELRVIRLAGNLALALLQAGGASADCDAGTGTDPAQPVGDN
jgi:hypothetical protein